MNLSLCGFSPISSGWAPNPKTTKLASWIETRAARLAKILSRERASHEKPIFLIATRNTESQEYWYVYRVASIEDLKTQEVQQECKNRMKTNQLSFIVQNGTSRVPYEQFLQS